MQEMGLLLQPIVSTTVGQAQQMVNSTVWVWRGGPGRLDEPGGGAEVPYTYHLHVNVNCLGHVMAVVFERNLPKVEL